MPRQTRHASQVGVQSHRGQRDRATEIRAAEIGNQKVENHFALSPSDRRTVSPSHHPVTPSFQHPTIQADWMMHLRADLEERFKQELEELEESFQMPYVTSVERIAKNEGRTEAAIETRQQTLVRLLRRRFGSVPSELVNVVETTNDCDQLDEWLDHLITAETLEELDIRIG